MTNVLEVNSLETLAESFSVIDKLDSFLENAMNELETLSVLCEAADENPENQTTDDKERFGKLKAIKEGVIKAVTAVWEWIEKAINPLIEKYNMLVRGKTPMILKADMTVNKYCFENLPPEIDKVMNDYIVGNNYKADGSIKHTAGNAIKVIDSCKNDTVVKKAKEKIEAIPIIKRLSAMKATKAKVMHKVINFKGAEASNHKDGYDQVILSVIRKLGSLYKDIIRDIHSIFNGSKHGNSDVYRDSENIKKYNEKNINKSVKDAQKNGGDEDMTNTESITIPEGMSKREYAARLMLEAAHIMLAEEDAQTQNEAVISNEKINARRDALNEAVNILYEKATLTEDAEEAAMYVEKADEIQKEIDELPEEKPVEMDEYPADDVTGGAGAGDEDKQEAIKELCDGDKQVMDLLLDDENKSVTVDADGESSAESTSQNESANLFNLDF